MNYELKNYSESYLDKQYEIGNAVIGTWLGGQQTPIDRLRKIYAQDDFDPETKFYALHDGEVVGFIPAKVTGEGLANLEFPIVLPGHEQAEKQLMEFALDTLRKKGVKKLVTRTSPRWGRTMEMADEYGYQFKEMKWKNATLNVEEYRGGTETELVQDVQDSDHPGIKEILVSFRENSEEEADKQITLLKRITERVTSWKVVREDGEIVGHDHLVEDIRNSTRARMNAIYASRDEIRDQIMNAHVLAAKRDDIQFITNFFWGPTENMDGPYLDYGFEVSELYAYELSL